MIYRKLMLSGAICLACILGAADAVRSQSNAVSDEEYAFISGLYPLATDLNLVIKDTTAPVQVVVVRTGYLTESITEKELKKAMRSISDETLADFNLKNAEARRLSDNFTFNGQHHLASHELIIDLIYSRKYPAHGWRGFRKEFGGAGFYQQFSRVGFNKTRDQALIYSAYYSPYFSSGTYSFYVKEGSVWKLKKNFVRWHNDGDI